MAESLAPSRRRVAVFALLAASLAGNIAVLFLPFMNLRVGLSTEPYSLLNSVRMLWRSHLYVLAALVVGFSVVFPFAKLGAIAMAAASGPDDQKRWHRFELAERFGKWSMLDVFIVCLILTLTSGQIMVGAEPLMGIPVFVGAIVASLVAGELLAATGGRPVAAKSPVKDNTGGKAAPVGGAMWLALSGLALAGAVGMPFLTISDWKLADRAYSIATLVPTLWSEDAKIPAIILGAFLVVAPAAVWIATLIWWRRQRTAGGDAERAGAYVARLRQWAMLDVFGLALAIFLVEGKSLMRTEVRWGALFLVGLLAAQWALQAALERSVARR